MKCYQLGPDIKLSELVSKRRNFSSLLINRLNAGGVSPEDEPSQPNRRRSPEASREDAISSKLEDSNISAAILCSDDTPSELTS